MSAPTVAQVHYRQVTENPTRHMLVLRVAQCAHGVGLFVLCVWTFVLLATTRSTAGLEWANHDVANTLYVGRVMAEGKRLYIDILELNPPSIFLFAESLERVACVARVSAFHIYHVGVLLLALYGGWLLQRIVNVTKRLELLILLGLAHMIVAFGAGSPGDRGFVYSFGQREHLFALVFVPYLFWRLSGACRDWSRYLALGLVGCAASMKPHFAVLVLVVELIWHDDTPTLRWRNWSVLTITVSAPYALLLAHSPDSFLALWTETMSYHTGGTYAAFDQPYSMFVGSRQHAWLLAYAVALLYFVWPLWSRETLTKRERICVAVLPVLGYLLVVQQRKFWDYHSIVVASITLVLVAYLASLLLPRLPRERRLAMLGLSATALLAALGSTFAVRECLFDDWKSDSGEMASILKLAPQLGKARNVLYYSTSIYHMRLAYSLDQRIVGNKCHDFDYPAIVRDRDQQRRSHGTQLFCEEQRRLVSSALPDAIVFLHTGQGLESEEQAEHTLLVEQCHVVPEQLYGHIPLPGTLQAHLYLRKKH